MQEFQSIDAGGRPIGEPSLRRSTWLELQNHASQPASIRVIDEVDLALPFGIEACWRYTVGTGNERTTYWFAKDRAGLPLQLEERLGGELVNRSVVIGDAVA